MRLTSSAAIPGSRIREIAVLADEHPGTLRLFYGEDTLPTPEFIKAAGRAAIERNKTYYAPNAGYPELREAIAESYSRLHGISVAPSETVATGSGMTAIVLACQATVGPGDSALVVTPLWPNLAAAVRTSGAEAIEVPLAERDGGFEIDLDALDAAAKPNTRLLALASPGNPTGWTATRDDWIRILEFCERRDLWLLADGVYERISFEGPVAPSPWEIAGGRDRVIVAQSFSKTYRMTGWRAGYNLAVPELAIKLAKLQEFVVSHPAGFTQCAAIAALREGEEFVKESLARYDRHRRIAVDRLSGIEGVELASPAGAFYVFPRLRGLADSFAFCRDLVVNHRLGIAPGSAFGQGGEGRVRICFAVDEATLRDGLDRFESAWTRFRNRL